MQVPLSVIIIWAYAFFLTAGGAFNYKGCSPSIPSSNILVDACRKHAYTMKHCRTDVSNAWSTAAWVRIPYPLQWGIPIFRFSTVFIMMIVSLVASVDSVSNLKPFFIFLNGSEGMYNSVGCVFPHNSEGLAHCILFPVFCRIGYISLDCSIVIKGWK